MHQHPRPSPRTASPASSPRTNPTRTNNPRNDQLDNMRGLGIERASGDWDNQSADQPSPEEMGLVKLNQIVQNSFIKGALIILSSRIDLPPAYSAQTNMLRINKWFNIELDETDVLREDVAIWRGCNFIDSRPPPMIIEVFLDASQLTHLQSLVIIDGNGKRCDVLEALSGLSDGPPGLSHHNSRTVVLERWKIELGDQASEELPYDLSYQLPSIYKRFIVLFRALWTQARFFPAWKLSRQRMARLSPAVSLGYRIYPILDDDDLPAAVDNLNVPLYPSNSPPVESFSFGSSDSPAGAISLSVTYRVNCDFRVDDADALLSSRFMGADDDFFRPSLPSEDTIRAAAHEVGSLPVSRRDDIRPDPGQAYGSLSTFHQIGPTTASPISALRAAREMHGGSPSSQHSPLYGQAARVSAMRSANPPAQRRPSVSIQAFKAPPLSASPLLSEPPAASHARTISALISSRPPANTDRSMRPPSVATSAYRRQSQISPDHAIASSTSASPKQAPISKYSSSFSHRRGRLSSGAGSKADEDNNSSGRASASSSTAQPGVPAEESGPGGGSSRSWHADEENISDFLKMLDSSKDLLSPSPGADVPSPRRTATALSRFHRMKDTNAVLSDSLTSSMMLQKSSTSSSRQLPNVPPMIGGASISGTSSSPGKAISPHTPHTPAIPSRLSANSIIDYSNRDTPNAGARRHRLSEQSHELTLEEASSDETTMEPPVSNAAAIDIPTSPPFVPNFGRSRSAAHQRRSSATADDEMGDFFFGMRSMSLGGADDRPPLSLSALLRRQDQDNPVSRPRPQEEEGVPPTDEPSPADAVTESRSSGPPSSPAGQSYQPRFPHPHVRGSTGRPQSRGSVSSSLGRGSALPSYVRDRERETGNDSGSNSGFSTTVGRRGSHRFSFTRNANFDEDEPLLFTMSDFGASRRSLEDARR